MSYPYQRGLFMKFATLCVLITCLVVFSGETTLSHRATTAPQFFTVQIESQPQSPLQIASTKVISPDPFSPNLEFTVTNKGSRGIRAYTVTYELAAENGGRKAALFTNLASPKNVLQPGQSRAESISEPYSPALVRSVILSVDFVESDDGQTWGNDAYNSADRLAGRRAGGDKALEHFRKVREARGATALLEAVTSGGDEIAPPEGRSPEWQDGFRTGATLVRQRLNKAKQRGGLEGMEEELRRPSDAKAGGPK